MIAPIERPACSPPSEFTPVAPPKAAVWFAKLIPGVYGPAQRRKLALLVEVSHCDPDEPEHPPMLTIMLDRFSELLDWSAFRDAVLAQTDHAIRHDDEDREDFARRWRAVVFDAFTINGRAGR